MKNLKDYLKMIVTAVTCFLMGFVKREKEYDWNWEMYGEIQETMLYGTTRKPK